MIRKSAAAAIMITAVLLGRGVTANAAEVKVLCANGMRAVLSDLQPQFERTTGHTMTASFGEGGDLRKRIQYGEIVDVIVLPRVVLDQLLTQGRLYPARQSISARLVWAWASPLTHRSRISVQPRDSSVRSSRPNRLRLPTLPLEVSVVFTSPRCFSASASPRN